MAKKTEKLPAARLTLVVDFEDEAPDLDALERILDEARSYGHITAADYETLKLLKKSLI